MGWMTAVVLLAVVRLPIPEPLVQEQRPDRQQLITELRNLGSVHVNEKQPGEPVVRVSLSGPRVTDGVIDTLTQFTELRDLSLSDTRMTGVGLRALSRLNGPKLSLSGLWVTDEIAQSVGELTKLRELHLIDTGVTDAGIRRLRNLSNLRMLDLDGVQITDEGLSDLGMLKSLEALFLSDTLVRGRGLGRLSPAIHLEALAIEGPLMSFVGLNEIKGLRTLFLTNTGINAQGLATLIALPNLERLVLSGGKFGDRELTAIEGFPRLARLDLTGVSSNLSDQASERLLLGIQGLMIRGDTCGVMNVMRARRSEELERRRLVRERARGPAR